MMGSQPQGGPEHGEPVSDGAVDTGDHLAPDPVPDWGRLSARMLLVHPVQEVVNYLPALVGVFLLGRAQDNALPWWLQLSLVGVPVVLGVLRYLTTSYRITSEQVQLRRGLFQRATLTAPLDRVRTVDVTSPPLHRVLGLARLRVGTGAGTPMELDGLTAAHATRLRRELLDRGDPAGIPVNAGSGPPGPPDVASAAGPARPAAAGSLIPGQEQELASFRASWLRLAPFTTSGWLSALAVWGFLGQFGSDLIRRVEQSTLGQGLEAHLVSLAWWMIVTEVLVVGLAMLVVFSLTGYVLSYWGYRLSRHSAGTLQVKRGLLTSRAVSLEEARIRGVSLVEPRLLRSAGGARLTGLLTGFSGAEMSEASSNAMLVPPAPVEAVRRTADVVLRSDAPLRVPLTPHGPAARRRRYVRAVTGGLFWLTVAAVPVWWWVWPTWILAPAALPLLLSPLIAADRYRSLGHAVADGHLVARSGVFPRQTDVLELRGIIGWNVESSFFQRRVGLVTLKATTAAGGGFVEIPDVPTAEAERLVMTEFPVLVRAFVAPAGPPAREVRSRTGTTSATATGRTG